MKLLRRFLAPQKKTASGPFEALIAPDETFYVIGDVHGCDALLETLLGQIAQEQTNDPSRIVFVGDYIDRGEQSAAVLGRIFEMCQAPENPAICLMGNHEDMMLQFLVNPIERGPRWLRYGGLQTLASFDVGGISIGTTGPALKEARDALKEAMGEPLYMWLRNLPLFWQSGNVAVVHAGADPALPISKQEAKTLKWGHKAFRHQPRQDGIWVVHGHTIVETANAGDGRIAVDTGAYATKKMAAAYISRNNARFLTT